MPITSAELLYDRVLPFYEALGVPVKAILTDNGREYCGRPEQHPYELLLASLAACTCITISWYCQGKNLPLESVSASYDFDRVHIKDCEDCDEPKKGLIDRITSNVHIEGNFDEAQRQRLAQIVERCPVHKTLANGVTFVDNASFSA